MLAAATRLTGRDRALVSTVDRFRVLTADQVEQMFFDSKRRAQARLNALYQLGVLDRFRPYRPQREGVTYHYCVGPLGHDLLVDGDDSARQTSWRRRRNSLALASSQRLAHLVGINGFYAGLVARARASTEHAVIEDWMTEYEAQLWTKGLVRPDAWGRWQEDGSSIEFFLEWDRGTESLQRLVEKLAGYERLERERGRAAWILFVVPSERRARNARAALGTSSLAIAVASTTSGNIYAADDVWYVACAASSRPLRLAELSAHMPSGASQERTDESKVRGWMYDFDEREPRGMPWL